MGKWKSVICIALIVVLGIGNGTSVSKAVTTYGISNPSIDKNTVTTWDTVYFGNYYQSNDKTKEPIRWRVLSVTGNDAFLMADQVLDLQPYYLVESSEVNWSNSYIRSWLNAQFLNSAFSDDEKSAVITTKVTNEKAKTYYSYDAGPTTEDKIYLLSVNEAINVKYGFASRIGFCTKTREAGITPYVLAKKPSSFLLKNNKYEWRLRTPLHESARPSSVSDTGWISDGVAQTDKDAGIRPVLHLDLSKTNLWKMGAKVTALGGGVVPKKPKKLTNLRIKSKSGRRVLVKDKKESGIDGYEIFCYYLRKGDLRGKRKIYTKKSTYTIKNMKKIKKKYAICVRSYRLFGKEKIYSNRKTIWVKIKK